MKKTLIILSTIFAFSSIAFAEGFRSNDAQTAAAGGFVSTEKSITVAQALTLPDDAWVILEGYIKKQTAKEKYLFSDSTGSVTIEIDKDKWRGLSVGPDDKVRITGEVDRGFRRIEIEVKQISKL